MLELGDHIQKQKEEENQRTLRGFPLSSVSYVCQRKSYCGDCIRVPVSRTKRRAYPSG